MIAANHTTLIDLARARLRDAESAFHAGDTDRHTNAATAAAAIATAATNVIIAEKLTAIGEYLATLADVADTMEAASDMAQTVAIYGAGK